MRFIAKLAVLLLLMVFSRGAWAAQMIQCEGCGTTTQFRSVAIQRGMGEYYVFSLANKAITHWIVVYDRELRRYVAEPGGYNANAENGFALMLEAEALSPGTFTAAGTAEQLRGDINKLGGGPHNPVAISLNGEHGSEYGSLVYFAISCLDSPSCAATLNPTLGKIAGAESWLNGIAISILGNSGSVQWENLPPTFKLWLCNSNNDCALLQYDKTKGWFYVESRAEGGSGKRYPRYGENLNYAFGGSGESGIFNRGITSGGGSIFGSWTLKTVLACVNVGGEKTCTYTLVPE